MKIVGITGGIGSGKSTVAKILRGMGYPVVDLDQIAHEVIEPGQPAYDKIRSFFGEEIIDSEGKIDRRRLGNIVFKDEYRRKMLESFTHPEISRTLQRIIEKYQSSGYRLLFLEVPLLFETGMDQWLRPVIVVKSSREVAIERLKRRNHLSDEEIWARMQSQMDVEEKYKRADYLVDNSGSLEDTTKQLVEILNQIEA